MTIEKIIDRISYMQERLCYAENNLQYIKRLQALKYWLETFDAFIIDREKGEYSAIYQSYFMHGCGFSFYDRVCNSILDYKYGNRPF